MKGDCHVLRFLLVVTVLAALVASCGCISPPPSVTTTSYFNAQVGTTSAQTPDPTAITAIDINSGNTRGCFADSGAQPSSPPLGSGWVGVGSSPGTGQCSFSGYAPGTWDFDFYSSQCAVVGSPLGQPFDFQGFLTTDSSGHVSQTVCTIPESAAPAAGSHFAISGSLPSTVTVGAPGLTTSAGMPQLLTYDSSLSLVSTTAASSVASDGSSATFPFPKNGSSSLSSGMYMFAVKNLTGSGQFKVVDATHFSVGGVTTLAAAFGIDAGDKVVTSFTCEPPSGGTGKCVPGTSSTTKTTTPTPILSEYYLNQVNYNGHTFAVGSEPVAIKEYGTSSVTNPNLFYDRVTTVQPSHAIVVNLGSASATILDLVGNQVLANVAVGSQPIAVAVNSGATSAYVVNYGSGTLSEISLSTYTVTRTATIGSQPQSVAIDPSGSYVWVGGPNYLKKVSLSTFGVNATQTVPGTITSLAASNAQNELVYTLVANCCSSSSTYSANELALSSMTSPGAYALATASPYSTFTMNGTLPSAANIPHATTVSANFGNGIAASATPTGFVIYDVVSHKQIMSGNTPTPVRGIASDPSNWVAYFTVPDSNEYISVPLPHQ